MLIIKLYINLDQIDEIHVQRIGPAAYWNSYAVRKPSIPGTVLHCRADGAVALAAVVLNALAEAGYGRRFIDEVVAPHQKGVDDTLLKD